MEKWKDLNAPEWLALDREKLIGEITRLPPKRTRGFPSKKRLSWNCIRSKGQILFLEKFLYRIA